MIKKSDIHIQNKRAGFDYEFLEKFVAGIRLAGTEIKSIRAGKASLVDSYCYFTNHELYVQGMHISEYTHGTCNNHEPKRDRKLLLKKKELFRLEKKAKEKGLTIIAFHMFINDRGLAKLEIALAKGKKEFDKREDIKQKDNNRELDRIKKSF